MTLQLINPNLCRQLGDLLGSGVPYMPVVLAYLIASLQKEKIRVDLIDAFGEAPEQVTQANGFWIHGLTIDQIMERINPKADFIAIYAISVMSFIRITEIIKNIKVKFPDLPIIILENSQAVTAFSLKFTSDELFSAGADFLLSGEADLSLVSFLKNYKKKNFSSVPGLIYKRKGQKVVNPIEIIYDIDRLPNPAWQFFPLKNYWKLNYSHGPVSGPFLPVLTSRGCPYFCAFCVVPTTNQRRWRPKSAGRIVEELSYLKKKFNVSDFHLEDLNPGMNKFRIVQMCKEILRQNLKITWKIIAGTKVEHLADSETIRWMAKAGCRYISISPESGSLKVLKLMQKPFDHHLALKLIQAMFKYNIKSQACFVLGFPGETKMDLQLTRDYIRQLVKSGLDEIALFILTPIPGSSTYGKITGYQNFSQMTFSPTWRKDYRYLSGIRMRMYFYFLLWKIMYHPAALLRQIRNILLKNFETKAEMVVYRSLKNFWLQTYGKTSAM